MLENLIAIAKTAGEKILEVKKTGDLKIKNKPGHGQVTRADIQANTYIISQLKTLFPKDCIYTEESGQVTPSSKNVWMVDPLDGTKGFIQGKKEYSVLIGYIQNGKPSLGVMYYPETKEVFYAKTGYGTYYLQKNHKPVKLTVSKRKKIENSIQLIRNSTNSKVKEFYKNIGAKESLLISSLSSRVRAILEKKGDFYINLENVPGLWDTCALQVLLEEAGGKITYGNGRKLNYLQQLKNNHPYWDRELIFSNNNLHSKLIEYYSSLSNFKI
jgi:3'(2'), 5'-bisphosphate nucleotidase